MIKRRIYYRDKHLKSTNITKYFVVYLVTSLALILSGVFFLSDKTIIVNKTRYVPQETKVMIIREANKFSEKSFVKEIKHLKLRFADIILAQAKLESNNFKSHIFLENNNMFGMKLAC